MADNGKGVLFKNNKKTKAGQPDYTGNFILTAELMQAWHEEMGTQPELKVDLAAWIKPGKSGSFLSLSVSAPYKGERKSFAPRRQTIEDDPPF